MRPAQRPVVEPLSPARYKIQFTASAELHDKLERLRSLMRSSVPDGELAAIIEEAVTEKLESLEAKRFAKTKSPRKSVEQADTSPKSRHIPAPVRRAVRERDGDRCSFVNEHGRRCTSRDRLEFHHRDPYGRGGDHSPENIRLMCKAHNGYLADERRRDPTLPRPTGLTSEYVSHSFLCRWRERLEVKTSPTLSPAR